MVLFVLTEKQNIKYINTLYNTKYNLTVINNK